MQLIIIRINNIIKKKLLGLLLSAGLYVLKLKKKQKQKQTKNKKQNKNKTKQNKGSEIDEILQIHIYIYILPNIDYDFIKHTITFQLIPIMYTD